MNYDIKTILHVKNLLHYLVFSPNKPHIYVMITVRSAPYVSPPTLLLSHLKKKTPLKAPLSSQILLLFGMSQ